MNMPQHGDLYACMCMPRSVTVCWALNIYRAYAPELLSSAECRHITKLDCTIAVIKSENGRSHAETRASGQKLRMPEVYAETLDIHSK